MHASVELSKDVKKARIETLHEEDPLREMPETDYVDDIVNAFHTIGRVSANGMGASPLPWAEIEAFCNSSLIDLRGWPALQVRKMSETYCSWLHKGSGFVAPYSRELTEEETIGRNKRIEEQTDKAIGAYNNALSPHMKPR